jgi:hypothetical protein
MFDIFELRSESASADADERKFCREWEAVYAALRDGPVAVAEVELNLFLDRYPQDGVARYHRSIYDEAAKTSGYRKKSKATLLGSGRR